MTKIVVNKSLFQGKEIGVALSGGRDSMCLLSVLIQEGIKPIAIHIEHGIRGSESIADMEFVKEYTKSKGIELKVFNVDAPSVAIEKGISLEQAAREERYRCFEMLLNNGIVDCIALAHHADDQAETILMRILRGTGIKGLQGMREDSGAYIRPLLNYTREEIDSYIEENNIPFVEDSTNADSIYTRNYLRKIIRSLKERYPNIEESFLRLARNAQDAEDFIDKFIPNPIILEDAVKVKIKDLKEKVIAARLIQRALVYLNVYQDIEEKHIEAIMDLASRDTGSMRELTHNIDAYKEGESIVFVQRENGNDFCVKLVDVLNGDVAVKKYAFFVQENIPTLDDIKAKQQEQDMPSKTLYMDCNKLPSQAVIRTRREGDYIRKFGG